MHYISRQWGVYGRHSAVEVTNKKSAVKQTLGTTPTALLPNDVTFRVATGSAEYRAVGYLRAQCFYNYPSDRSEFARRAHMRMKGDEMWQQLEEVAFKYEEDDSIVIPMIATVDSDLGLHDTSVGIPTQVGMST